MARGRRRQLSRARLARLGLWASMLPQRYAGAMCGYTCRQEKDAFMNDEAQRNYSQYISWQVEKTDFLSHGGGPVPAQWVMEPEIAKAAAYARLHLPLRNRFALSHGSRSGREVLWFRRHLPQVQTWGTELSGIAAAKAAWTFQHDFNVVRPVTHRPYLSNPPADRVPTLTLSQP